MRFMMMMRASKSTEAGGMPSEALLEAMARYNEELARAGVLVDGAGLYPSSHGARVTFTRGKPTVVGGPFAGTKELIAGYTMLQVGSLEEAVAWAKRCPFDPALHYDGGDGEIELRRVFELDDFAYAPDAVAHHKAVLAAVEA